MNKDRILLYSLLEEVLRIDCKNFSGKDGCILVWRKGIKPKRRSLENKRQSIVLSEDNRTCPTDHTEGHSKLQGAEDAILFSFEGSQSF